jgi:hypothetical protein
MPTNPTDRDDEPDERDGDAPRYDELAASPAAGVLDPGLPDPPEPSEPA